MPSLIYFFIKFGKKLPSFLKSIGALKLTVILLTLFAASSVAIQAPTNFDTGLYHLNSIRWNNEYHIIKGIGNLHTRLGFNQTFFLYCSSLSFHPFLNEYAFHASNSFLYALFFVGLIMNGTFIDLLIACLFFFIPMPYHWLTSPTPDLASTFIQIITFRYFVEAILFQPKSEDRMSLISFVAILSALLFTIKLSNIVYVAGLGMVTLLFNKKYSLKDIEKKQLGRAFIFIGIFFAIWIVRGYIQTGYPLFPSSIGGLNTNWTVPKEIAKRMENNVYAGSRSGETLFDIESPLFKNYAWLPLWMKKSFYDDVEFYWNGDFVSDFITVISLILFPSTVNNWGIGSATLFLLSLLLLIIFFTSAIRKKYNIKGNLLFYLLLAEVASILFWFFMAPCLRFSNGIFIILFTTSLLLVKVVYPELHINLWLKKLLLFYSFILFIWNCNTAYFNDELAISGIIPPPSPLMKEMVTKSGLKIWFPPTKNCQGWNCIPSTPDFNKNLSLLGNSLNEGFCIKQD
ncbi:MAG: hypothetical protein J6Z11_02110 [Candidatus Riflebacteria bacterium]|nr:hypothetical protein [Candidatus Riflebacteria bacterium]